LDLKYFTDPDPQDPVRNQHIAVRLWRRASRQWQCQARTQC